MMPPEIVEGAAAYPTPPVDTAMHIATLKLTASSVD